MDISLPIYGESPKCAKLTKILQAANDISIGRNHDNPMLDKIFYDVEYLDGHK